MFIKGGNGNDHCCVHRLNGIDRGDRGTVEHGAQWNFSVCRLVINVVFDKFWILGAALYRHFVIWVDGLMFSLLLLS